MNEQQWYEIEGFSKYLVNPYDCKIMNKESKYILSPADCGGYPRIKLLRDDGTRKAMFCHRIFMHLLSGIGGYVNHKDGNKNNWHIDNLELVTHKENVLHCTRILDRKIKNNHSGSKKLFVTNITTKETIEFPSTNEAARYIAEKFNVSMKKAEARIYTILHNKTSNKIYFGFTFEREAIDIDLTDFYPYPKNTNYLVSKDGRIYSLLSKALVGGQINMYRTIKLVENGKYKTAKIHIMVAETFLPNPDNLPIVDHIDRDKLNNNLDNLRWVSYRDNCINSSNVIDPKNKGVDNYKSKQYASFDSTGKLVNIFVSKAVINECKLSYLSIKNAVKNNSLYRDLYWKNITAEEYLLYDQENPNYKIYKGYTKQYEKLYISCPVVLEKDTEKFIFKTLKEAGNFLGVSANSIKYNIKNKKIFKGFSFSSISKEEYLVHTI
jgi:hypothetical protein